MKQSHEESPRGFPQAFRTGPTLEGELAMAEKYLILGRVISRVSQQGIPNLRVEAWDKDLIVDDLVASAVTDATGAFRMEFDSSYFRELFVDRQPDLFFRVFDGGKLIKSTEDSVLWNVGAETEITIEVDVAVSRPTNGSARNS